MATPPLILSSSRAAPGRPGRDRPRSDFELLAEALACPLLFPGPGARPVAALEQRLRLDLSQAVRARRHAASAYISLSERVGIPLGLLRPDAPHVIVAHLLTSASKRAIARLTGYLKTADAVLVFAAGQLRYLREVVGLPAERARFVSDKVDATFFRPGARSAPHPYVLSVGREQRDYRTLVEAIRPLGVRCVLVPGSAWSHRGLDGLSSVPDGVEVRSGLSYVELRELYRKAAMVVVPVHPGTDYAAGVNGVLEGMACARPVIASRTPGLEGYIEDQVDGRVVPAGDVDALRAMIGELLDDRDQSERLGAQARQTVEQGRTTEHFVAELVRTVRALV
jgi:glycosyltransferase involved in cell wall biosynthesis